MLKGLPCAACCPLSYLLPDSVVLTGPQKPWAKVKERVTRVVAEKSSFTVCVYPCMCVCMCKHMHVSTCMNGHMEGWKNAVSVLLGRSQISVPEAGLLPFDFVSGEFATQQACLSLSPTQSVPR